MKTTDLWFAAFLKFKGYKISDFVVLSRGKGQYTFNMVEKVWKEERLNFLNSDISKIKQIMEQLKDLLY